MDLNAHVETIATIIGVVISLGAMWVRTIKREAEQSQRIARLEQDVEAGQRSRTGLHTRMDDLGRQLARVEGRIDAR